MLLITRLHQRVFYYCLKGVIVCFFLIVPKRSAVNGIVPVGFKKMNILIHPNVIGHANTIGKLKFQLEFNLPSPVLRRPEVTHVGVADDLLKKIAWSCGDSGGEDQVSQTRQKIVSNFKRLQELPCDSETLVLVVLFAVHVPGVMKPGCSQK